MRIARHVEALDLPWCKRQFSEGNLMDLAILNLFSTMLEIYSLTVSCGRQVSCEG